MATYQNVRRRYRVKPMTIQLARYLFFCRNNKFYCFLAFFFGGGEEGRVRLVRGAGQGGVQAGHWTSKSCFFLSSLIPFSVLSSLFISYFLPLFFFILFFLPTILYFVFLRQSWDSFADLPHKERNPTNVFQR